MKNIGSCVLALGIILSPLPTISQATNISLDQHIQHCLDISQARSDEIRMDVLGAVYNVAGNVQDLRLRRDLVEEAMDSGIAPYFPPKHSMIRYDTEIGECFDSLRMYKDKYVA